jgi:NAD(P)-dependent dehydrogenase (short-subunit alcohol dehydrogenase family)
MVGALMDDGRLILAGRVAVVTGATGGLGSAACQGLAQAGACVVVVFRQHENAARKLAQSLVGGGHSSMYADVTDSASLERLAQEVAARYETIDVLVNSVGKTRFVPHADLKTLSDELIDDIFRTNWRGPFATIRALQPLLANRDGGVVVNISSVAGVTGVGSNVAYCASKAALNLMTLSLARALAPAIRVVAVSPGLVDTDFVKGIDQSWRQEQTDRTPLGRLASPEDVSRAVLAVVTTLTYSTGCIIQVDGGRPLA